MTQHLPDIDIDVADRDRLLKLFEHTQASIVRDNNLYNTEKHKTGVYFTDVPKNPFTNTASLDHKQAESMGYFKLDILNMSVYEQVKNEEHLVQLMQREPPWHRLWTDSEYVSKIVHINNYYDMLCDMKPDSIERMAMFLAVIRPAKRHLQTQPWAEIAQSVWEPPEDDSYYFKKSHSVGYAHLVVVHMNLLDLSN